MTSILGQRAAQYAAAMCDDYDVGYSQHNRWDLPDIADLVAGTGYGGTYEGDCSSLTARAYNAAIVSLGLQGRIPLFPESDATWTGTWRSLAVTRDFSVEEWYLDIDLDIGDLLLSEGASGGTGHIAMYTGGDAEREAWISEIGDIYGAPGDQTDEETRTKSYSGHPLTVSGQWTHVLHPPAVTPTPAAPSTPSTTTVQEDDDMNSTQNYMLTQVFNDRAEFAQLMYALRHSILPTLTSLQGQITAQGAAIKALADAKGADGAQVARSIDAAVKAALAGVEITLAAKETAK